MADNGGTKVTDMEGLCHVGRGIVENDGLTLTIHRRAVFVLQIKHLAYNSSREGGAVDLEIKIAVYSRNRGKLVTLDVSCKHIGDLHGRTAQSLGQTEARKRDISHRAVRRIFKHLEYIVCREKSLAKACAYCIGNKLCCVFL